MKRRNFLLASLAAFFAPAPAKALTIDEWSLTPGQAGEGASGIVKPSMPGESLGIVKPSMPIVAKCKKAMQWAAMCLRQGTHWTFEGIGWLVATLPFMRNHLCNVHGHRHYEVDGLDREQLIALHDDHHEGRANASYSIPPTPPNGVNRMPQATMNALPQVGCPNGHCPTPQRFRRS